MTMQDAQYAHRLFGRPEIDASVAIGQCLQSRRKLVAGNTWKAAQRNPFNLSGQVADKARCGDRVFGGNVDKDIEEVLICERGIGQLFRFNIRIPRSMMESARASAVVKV